MTKIDTDISNIFDKFINYGLHTFLFPSLMEHPNREIRMNIFLKSINVNLSYRVIRAYYASSAAQLVLDQYSYCDDLVKIKIKHNMESGVETFYSRIFFYCCTPFDSLYKKDDL